MKTQHQIKFLSSKTDFKPLLKLTIPLILTGVLQVSISFFENIFLAHLGHEVLAAGSLVTLLSMTILSLIFGLFSAVSVLISHQFGANNYTSISLILRDSLILVIIFSLLVFFLYWNASAIYLLIGQTPKLIELANAYLHALAWGVFPKFILIIIFQLLIGLGHARLFLMMIFIIPFYILLSYALIFGKFGFPMIGIAGAGWGITIIDWIIAIIACILLWFSKTYSQYVRSLFTLAKPSFFWEILQIGIPIGFMHCVEIGYFFLMTISMGWISIATLAANQIVMQYLGVVMSVLVSIAQGITVRIGHLLGANEINGAERAVYVGIIFSLVFILIIAQFFWFFPTLLIAVDLKITDPINAETVRLAILFLYISAFYQILEAIRTILFSALRGLKDTRFSLITSIICLLCIAYPLGYLLSIHLNWGGKGFWFAIIVGTLCNIVLLFRRFNYMMKRLKKFSHS